MTTTKQTVELKHLFKCFKEIIRDIYFHCQFLSLKMQSKSSTFKCFLVFMKFIGPLLGSEADAVISSLMSSGFGGRIVRQTDSVNNISLINLLDN